MHLETKTKEGISNTNPAFNKMNAQYRSVGIYTEVLESSAEGIPTKVKITQAHLYNGYILNQKQLVDRAKTLFGDVKVVPVVFSLDISFITTEWLGAKMIEFGVKRSDLIKQLAVDKSSLSLYLNGKVKMNKLVKSAFYYYFLTYELNRDFRA